MRGRQRNRGSIDARNAAMQATMCSLSRNKVDVQVRVEEGGESGCGPRNLNPLLQGGVNGGMLSCLLL
jgi:hypothetical protein